MNGHEKMKTMRKKRTIMHDGLGRVAVIDDEDDCVEDDDDDYVEDVAVVVTDGYLN